MGVIFPNKGTRTIEAVTGNPVPVTVPPTPEPPTLEPSEPANREAYARRLIEFTRAESADGRLTSLSALASRFPPPEELREVPGFSIASAIAEVPDADDLKKIEGSSGLWYFSETSMTGAYALHLLRTEEKDPLRLIAETVRDESRIYPRPTDLMFFTDPPFSMNEKELRQALGGMELRPDMRDIRRCVASNGAMYLYSTQYLGETLAETLAEWIEVGQRQNP
ncbi:MAG TPA: hypothetical protein VN445_06000 [Rectinemataceae bacterium]|nr:hypothetical protein [Rectinemataceae bacterium]